MAEYVCENCGGKYQPSGGRQKHCPKCLWLTLSCERCGNTFQRRRSEQEKHAQRFCSLRCSTAVIAPTPRHGSENNRYNGGLCFFDGRWIICCTDGSVMWFSRGVMEAELRRPLRSDEIVHHINGNTTDDRPENLQILTRSEHAKLHHARGDLVPVRRPA